MDIKYDADIDFLEVIESNTKNYGTSVSESLTLFLAEKDNSIVGFQLIGVRKNINELEIYFKMEKK